MQVTSGVLTGPCLWNVQALSQAQPTAQLSTLEFAYSSRPAGSGFGRYDTARLQNMRQMQPAIFSLWVALVMAACRTSLKLQQGLLS